MATRIRLQRHGRKNYAFYSIVIADSNAPRDGRFVEKLGTYNPNTNPSCVVLDFDRALYWVLTGAQPTTTVKNILSKEGVYLMKHLLGGVKKGCFTEEEAKQKFEAWKSERENKLQNVADAKVAARKAEKDARLKAEKAVKEAIAKKVAEKNAPEPEATEEEAPVTEETAPVAEETPATEEATPAEA